MKTAGGVTTFFVHDDQGNEIAEYNGGWALQRRLAYDPAYLAPMAMTTAAGGVTFNYFDRQGSVVAIANAAGTKITHYAYLPFGDSHPSGTPISNCQGTTCGDASGTGFGYVGYRYDQETGLYHTGARYYDPRLGRFLQMDPIGQAGGLNLYAYVLNDPLNLVDPSGLIASTAAGVVDATYSLIQNPAALGHLATGVVAGALGTSLKGGGAGLGLAGIVGDEPIAIGGGAAVYAAGRALQAYGAAEIATGLVLMNQKQGSDGGLRGSIEQEIRSSQNTGGRLVGDIGRPKAIANPDPALGRGQVRYQVRFADEFGKITNYSVNYDPATGIFGTIKPASGR
jgi:RHS repeat-associated protein